MVWYKEKSQVGTQVVNEVSHFEEHFGQKSNLFENDVHAWALNDVQSTPTSSLLI